MGMYTAEYVSSKLCIWYTIYIYIYICYRYIMIRIDYNGHNSGRTYSIS